MTDLGDFDDPTSLAPEELNSVSWNFMVILWGFVDHSDTIGYFYVD